MNSDQKTPLDRATSFVGSWIVVALDVWLGSRFGFGLGLLISAAVGALIGAGWFAARRAS